MILRLPACNYLPWYKVRFEFGRSVLNTQPHGRAVYARYATKERPLVKIWQLTSRCGSVLGREGNKATKESSKKASSTTASRDAKLTALGTKTAHGPSYISLMKQQYQLHLCSLTLNNQCFLRFCFSEFKGPLALSKTVNTGIKLQHLGLVFFFYELVFTYVRERTHYFRSLTGRDAGFCADSRSIPFVNLHQTTYGFLHLNHHGPLFFPCLCWLTYTL